MNSTRHKELQGAFNVKSINAFHGVNDIYNFETITGRSETGLTLL